MSPTAALSLLAMATAVGVGLGWRRRAVYSGQLAKRGERGPT
jgi:hypothetical protein